MNQDPLTGRQLANFRIEHLIGQGGMAQVYYGWDVKLERPVAVKVIDARYRDNPIYAERFVREAQSVAAWRHENIVQVYYADDQDGLYYFVMEYIEGLDLRELLFQYAAESELMPHDDVLRIVHAIANALDYAHQKGVIHRDVKPSNVMVAGDGRVVLTDFGLALDVQEGSLGQVFGTSHYISPEQARSSADAVPQSDLYSLGVILYEMLVGVVPFDDPSPASVAVQHLTQPPPPPREINPNLGQETEVVLLKVLSKSPEERYQTGGGVMDALEKALQLSPFAFVEQDGPSLLPASVQPLAVRSLSETSVEEKVVLHLQSGAKPTPSQDLPSKKGVSLLGRQLDEYRLDVLLGQGGMARVYRGLDVHLKRYVAIKVIDASFRTDLDYIKRFELEAQAIAKLEHPHIVRLYRYGESDGLLYMAMQYIEGNNLSSILARYRERQAFIEPKDARRIVREICLALDYAHSQGVIHRDVKSSNIMLDEQGNAILTDFGLALLTELGTQGEIFGSPHYIAPEQVISSAKVVPQSDLYAVGIILYEMFTGERPFDAEDPLDIAMQHMAELPRSPRELRPETSSQLEAVILKALAKEPEERYQSGAELADALDEALQAMPVQGLSLPVIPGSSLSPSPQVTAEAADRPLPPIPAAVAVVAPQQVERRAEETATGSSVESISSTPVDVADLPTVRASDTEAEVHPTPSEGPTPDRPAELEGTETDFRLYRFFRASDHNGEMRWTLVSIILVSLIGMIVCGVLAFFLLGGFDLLQKATSTPLTSVTPVAVPAVTPIVTPSGAPRSTETPIAAAVSVKTFMPMFEYPVPLGSGVADWVILKCDGDSLGTGNRMG